jgi:hypothetical protein
MTFVVYSRLIQNLRRCAVWRVDQRHRGYAKLLRQRSFEAFLISSRSSATCICAQTRSIVPYLSDESSWGFLPRRPSPEFFHSGLSVAVSHLLEYIQNITVWYRSFIYLWFARRLAHELLLVPTRSVDNFPSVLHARTRCHVRA